MKVKTLIKRLQRFDPETRVVVHGYEGGYSYVTTAKGIPVCLNVNNGIWYYGEHDNPQSGQKPDATVISIC